MVRSQVGLFAACALTFSVACAGCSNSTTPTSPSPSTPAPIPTPTVTFTAHVTATNGGQPLSALSANLGNVTTVTDSSGTFRASLLPSGTLRLALNGSGIVPRSISVAVNGSRDVSLDAIALGGAFDLTFYRAMVRHTYEAPDGLEPLRRWTRTPSIY